MLNYQRVSFVFKIAFHESYKSILSGWWFGKMFMFPYIGNVIIQIDELIFLRRVDTYHQPVVIIFA